MSSQATLDARRLVGHSGCVRSERLGEVTVPSGTLRIFDSGALALVRDGLIPAVQEVRVDALPIDRALPVYGERVGAGELAELWDHVRVEVQPGAETARFEAVGGHCRLRAPPLRGRRDR